MAARDGGASPRTVFTGAGPRGQTFERAVKPLCQKGTRPTALFDNGWGEEIPKLLIAPPDLPPYEVIIVAPFEVYAVNSPRLLAEARLAQDSECAPVSCERAGELGVSGELEADVARRAAHRS